MATCKLTIIKRESPLVVVALNRARSTGGNEGRAATGEPDLHFLPLGRPAPTGSGRCLTCDRDSTLIVGAHYMRRNRRWRTALSRAMSWLSTTKENHMSPGENIALVVRRTSSVTRRPNYINIHRFWDRRPGNSHNRRLDIGIGDSEVLTESNRKCLLQCGRLRTIKR